MTEGLLLILGASVGSFLAAYVWRIRDGRSILAKKGVNKKRSFCERCYHKLDAIDLIPIFSWLFLRGRCRHCKDRISWQHPFVESITAAGFFVSYVHWPMELAGLEEWSIFILWLGFLSGLIAMAIYDFRHLEIANRLIYPMIFMAILYRFIDAAFLDGGAESMREMTQGLLVGGGMFFALYYVSKEKWIGGGDVKLGFFFGAWLGPGKAAVALVIGFYSAFLIVVPLLLTRRVSRRQPIPFGPFLMIGVFVATLWGQELFDWYTNNFI